MTTLEDLYYGNISPHERYIKRGTRVDKLVKLICKNEEELNSGLTEKQKETFEKFKDCTSELSCITEREAFSESTDNDIGNDNNRNTNRNNTACDVGRPDRVRKRPSPNREQGTGNRADCGRHRANNNGKAEDGIQANDKLKTQRAIGGGNC